MFSKLQLCILAGCILVASAIFGIFALNRSAPLREAPGRDSSAYSRSETAETEPAAPRAIPKLITAQNSPSIITNGNEGDEKIIDAVMGKFASSFKTGDGSVMIDTMYTPILQAIGGGKKASEELKVLMTDMKEQELVKSWKIKKPYLYVAGKAHKYVVIPYEVKMNVLEKIITQNSYELGIKTADSGWQFAGGDVLSPELYEKFFPDFPKDVELPAVEQSTEN